MLIKTSTSKNKKEAPKKGETQKLTMMSRKAYTAIPKVKLSMKSLMLKADMRADICSYDSSITASGHATGYAADETGVLVMTSTNGYLRIPYEDIGTIIGELQNIEEDIRYWRSVGGLKQTAL